MTYKSRKSVATAEVKDATGQVIEGQLYLHLKREGKVPPHTRMLVEGLLYLSSSGLAATDFALLCYLIARSNWQNECWLNREEAKLYTNILPSNQYKSLNNLLGKGLLMKGDKDGARQLYLINPKIAFKGNALRYETLLKAVCSQVGIVLQDGEVV